MHRPDLLLRSNAAQSGTCVPTFHLQINVSRGRQPNARRRADSLLRGLPLSLPRRKGHLKLAARCNAEAPCRLTRVEPSDLLGKIFLRSTSYMPVVNENRNRPGSMRRLLVQAGAGIELDSGIWYKRAIAVQDGIEA